MLRNLENLLEKYYLDAIGNLVLAEARAHLIAQEQKARLDAENANRAKDEFLAMLGHELRNPLAPIRTGLEIIPVSHVDEVLPLMAEGLVLPYLDVPLQHSHPDVLRRMKRPASGERNLERIQQWRDVCPELVVRSTFIAGFPGETEDEFAHLLDFVREAQIDRAGCFAYSPVEGAAANALADPVPEAVREERRARFMAVAEAVSADKLRSRVGATMQVLVDSAPGMGKKGGVGRSYADAPEIDGVVRLLPPEKISKTLKVGEFTKARIVGTQGHDLVAVPV